MWTEIRKLTNEFASLDLHIKWRENQRAYVKQVQASLEDGEICMVLDYGSFWDSDSKKISCLSITLVFPGDREDEHLDLFFDAVTGAKKSGSSTIYWLENLLARPTNGEHSILEAHALA